MYLGVTGVMERPTEERLETAVATEEDPVWGGRKSGRDDMAGGCQLIPPVRGTAHIASSRG